MQNNYSQTRHQAPTKLANLFSSDDIKHFGFFGMIIALLVAGYFYFISASKMSSEMPFASQGSLTACIELNAIANEIEITGSAMKRASAKVSGFNVPFSEEDDESSPYCALKLA